ncbi:hypothetical protein [Corynebacterium freneyi]|uniref:Recombinase RecT n=1 Tax=Corynebacterium freneyi DNF00450 TaxID=1287475 RepID=A0A095Y5T4_9CORY|nr:hypothetical protein [Corynebacterium freneyi]KGF17386.1 hypothetical protein HMPREF1650_04295 [Corynebacterium freneyi DNF00450]
MTTPNLPDTNDTDTAELMPMGTPMPLDDMALASLEKYARSMDIADRIAEGIYRTDYAGPFKGKKADMAIAILSAAGLGIRPENVGKAIYVVHGTPSLYGKTALAIAKSHGYKMRKTEESDQVVTCVFTAPDGEEYPVTYTYDRAEREGLVKGNPVQYKTRPEKMLTWKCVGEAADMFFPHVLNNLPIKEDIEQGGPVRAKATRADRPAAGGGALSAIEAARSRVQARRAATEEPIDTDHDQEPAVDVQAVIDGNAMLRELLDALVDCDSEQAMHSEVGSRVSELGGDAAALGVLRAAWNERAEELRAGEVS